MIPVYKLQNIIQPYAWGSRTALAELTGQPVPSKTPQAELWMGAHPKAPSKILFSGEYRDLDQLIQQYPDFILGKKTAQRFGNRFPFLFKVLAVDQPLSIQAHPDLQQARRGFQLENQKGIALSAPHRNYKDDQHKPECVCALTPFSALCGFRSTRDMQTQLKAVWPSDFSVSLDKLSFLPQAEAIRSFLSRLLRLPKDSLQALIDHVSAKAQVAAQSEPVYEWMVRLSCAYPGDVGVIAPAILNLVTLKPGEALFLPSGQLHAYLQGVAVELMANSDNVLRGGLTPKHVDVDELLKVVGFAPRRADLLETVDQADGWRCFAVGVEEFALCRTVVESDRPCYGSPALRGPQIILCTRGRAEIDCGGAGSPLNIGQGDSVLVAAASPQYRITGDAELFRATTGLIKDN